MKVFQVITDTADYTFQFPTSMDELDEEYLRAITDHIDVAPYHTLVGMIYKESLANIIMTFKQKKKGVTAAVTPIFIKQGVTKDESESIKATLKDVLVIPASSLSLGYQINIPHNELSIDFFTRLLDDDPEAYKRVLGNDARVYFVQFKIVPNNEIKGVISKPKPNIPYMYVREDNKCGTAN